MSRSASFQNSQKVLTMKFDSFFRGVAVSVAMALKVDGPDTYTDA